MATVSRLAMFWRAFFAALLSGTLASAATKDEMDLWQSAVAANTADGYYQYLSLYPAGAYVDGAVAALGRLGTSGAPREIAPVRGPRQAVVKPVAVY